MTEDDDIIGTPTSEVHYEFDAAFQDKIAALLLRDNKFAQLTDGLIKPDYFEDAGVAGLVRVANNYFEKYKKVPGDKTILASLLGEAKVGKILTEGLIKQAVIKAKTLFETDVSDREYVADQCAIFARHQAMSKAILESVDLIEKRDFDSVGLRVKKALEVGVSLGLNTYDYADNLARRTADRKDRAAGIRPPTGISTGYAVLDDYLYHKGWGRREMSVLMGGPKAGKSMAMIGFGVNAIAAGYKVLYITLEVASEIIAQRMDANIAGRAMMELELHPHDVEKAVGEFMAKAAPFKINEYPTGMMRPSDLGRLIEHYKTQGLTFDLVIVDYADLMIPDRITDSVQENSKGIYQMLRGLAMQEGFALLTATQTNRDGAKKAVATMTDVAEDINKIRIADVVISINSSEEEKKLGEARLYFAASRNQRSGFTVKIKQDVDCGKFIKEVIGED